MYADQECASALTDLSLEAVCSAAALGDQEVSTLFGHLYSYNSVPLTEIWGRRFSDAEAVREELGLSSGGHLGSLLAEHWVSVPEERANGWLNWLRPTRSERLAGSGSTVEFKLYLSPAFEALPGAVAGFVETLSFSQAISFKVGAHAADLRRPDKVIAYFRTQADLAYAAQRLAECLVRVPAQGVPFTAEIAGNGLLSWGVDPPARSRVLGETARSWREWVCYRLAVALVEAEKESSEDEPAWQWALERLRRMGVDTERWLLSPASWGSALR